MFIEHKREVCVLSKFRECIKFSLPRRLSHLLVIRNDKKCYHVFTQCYGGSKSFNFDGDQWATVCCRDMLSICRLIHIAEINQITQLCREPTGEIKHRNIQNAWEFQKFRTARILQYMAPNTLKYKNIAMNLPHYFTSVKIFPIWPSLNSLAIPYSNIFMDSLATSDNSSCLGPNKRALKLTTIE